MKCSIILLSLALITGCTQPMPAASPQATSSPSAPRSIEAPTNPRMVYQKTMSERASMVTDTPWGAMTGPYAE